MVAVPFALTNPNVKSITKTSADPVPYVYNNQTLDTDVGWLGYMDAASTGLYIDTFLLMMLGGVPWQAYFQRALSTRNGNHSRILSLVGGFLCFLLAIPPALIGAAGYSAGRYSYCHSANIT